MKIEIGIDAVDLDRLTHVWAVALDYERGFNDDDTYRDLIPKSADGPTLFIQKVVETKVGKNRVHIDIYVFDPLEKVGALTALGASSVGEPHVEGGWWWQVMVDPEGNEFCVCRDFVGRKD